MKREFEIYIYIYIYIVCTIYWEKRQVKHSIYRLVLPGGFFRVEEFTNLLVFVNNVYNWKICRHINDFLKQFLLPMKKVCTPSIERMMTVKELLNVVKFLFQIIWVYCFQFQNPKVYICIFLFFLFFYFFMNLGIYIYILFIFFLNLGI